MMHVNKTNQQSQQKQPINRVDLKSSQIFLAQTRMQLLFVARSDWDLGKKMGRYEYCCVVMKQSHLVSLSMKPSYQMWLSSIMKSEAFSGNQLLHYYDHQNELMLLHSNSISVEAKPDLSDFSSSSVLQPKLPILACLLLLS